MDLLFWKGKKVFLTGHTGFKGSWLSLWLQKMGAEVTGFALPAPTHPSLFDIANISSNMTSISGDIRDREAIKIAIQKAEPEIVIHMAAQALVRYSYVHPVETYATNVMGLIYLFEAIRDIGCVKAVLNVTSDKCYENKEKNIDFCEEDPMGGIDPYSSSKGCAELVTTAYRCSYNLALASARAGNVIGGGDWAEDRLIPDILKAIVSGENVEIRNPDAIRPWQHVLEPIAGYLKLTQALYENGPTFEGGWNFGPKKEDAKSVGWIVEHLTKKWGEGVGFNITPATGDLHEAQYLKLDCTKANRELKWEPKWNLPVALDKTIQWHKAYLSQKDMQEVTLQQITDYMEQKL